MPAIKRKTKKSTVLKKDRKAEDENTLKNELRALKKKYEELKKEEQHRLSYLKQNEKEEMSPKSNDAELMLNLYKYAGIMCKSCDENTNKFLFPILNEDGTTQNYYMKLLLNDDKIKVDKHFMPPGIDIETIVSEFSVKKVTKALVECRQYIFCFYDRKRQYEELKKNMKKYQYCEMFHNDSFSHITVRFLWVEDINLKKRIQFNINLFYNFDEALPRSITITPVFITLESEFDEQTVQMLKKLFGQPFKSLPLNSAMDVIIESDKEFFKWSPREILEDNNSSSRKNQSENEYSSDADSINAFLDSIEQKKKKKTKKSKTLKEKVEKKMKKNEVKSTEEKKEAEDKSSINISEKESISAKNASTEKKKVENAPKLKQVNKKKNVENSIKSEQVSKEKNVENSAKSEKVNKKKNVKNATQREQVHKNKNENQDTIHTAETKSAKRKKLADRSLTNKSKRLKVDSKQKKLNFTLDSSVEKSSPIISASKVVAAKRAQAIQNSSTSDIRQQFISKLGFVSSTPLRTPLNVDNAKNKTKSKNK